MMQIRYEDDEILVCEKEAGLATQSANIRSTDLVSLLKIHLAENGAKGSEPYLGIIHRLDQPVSGLLVFAKTPSAAASLSKLVQTEQMNKIYRATVEGILPQTDGPVILTDYLIRDGKQNKALVVQKGQKGPDGKPAREAVLSYEVLSFDPASGTSLVKVILQTGRFHQIRAQLSHLGHPIIRDRKYGATLPCNDGNRGIGLCACELNFIHPKTKKEMHFAI